MAPNRPSPTVDSVKNGCGRLARQLASLQREVTGLSEKVARFTRGRAIPDPQGSNYWVDWARGERTATPEPDSPIFGLKKTLFESEITLSEIMQARFGTAKC